MGNELLCTQTCAGCAESIGSCDLFIYLFFGEGARCQDLSSKCLSNEIFVPLRRDGGQCLCFVFPKEKVQTRRRKIEGNHFQYVHSGLIISFFFFFLPSSACGGGRRLLSCGFLPKCPHLLG